MTSFCGALIKPIKEIKTEIPDKIIVSTCYFHYQSILFYENKYGYGTMTYLNGLISNIETFYLKIQKYTTNPEKWIYRVYIDEAVLNIKSIMDNIRKNEKIRKNTKLSKIINDKSDAYLINELDYNYILHKNNISKYYDNFIFIETLLKKYITMISNSNDAKYKNIEIFTYNNDELHYKLSSNPEKYISSTISTYGTLMRFHPLTDANTSVVIMRNCSHNMTPLDIIIQNYWIIKSDKEYMEYVDKTYDFTMDRHEYIPYRKQFYMTLYNKSTNSIHEKAAKIKHFGYDRVMAGLIGVKINNKFHSYTYYTNIFDKLYDRLKSDTMSSNIKSNIHKLDKDKIIYDYGIDEAIIQFIFPELRSASYSYTNSKDKQNEIQHTFAIEFKNGGKPSCCNKCDKTKLQSKIQSVYKLKNITRKTKTKTLNSKIDKKCCLKDIYKNDTEYYSMPKYMQYYLNNNTIPEDMQYLRSLPFQKLNINTWQISRLVFNLVTQSILFIHKYNFAVQDKFNIKPTFIKRHRIKPQQSKNTTEIQNTTNDNTLAKKTKKTILKETDKYAIICNIRKKDHDVDKYLNNLQRAYGSDNFYPVLIYPKQLKILDYKNTKHTIEFKKLLEPISNKHGFLF